MSRTKDLPEHSRRLRELRGIRTQIEVSRATGIPQCTISACEGGVRPSAEVAHRFAQFYGVPVAECGWTPPTLPIGVNP